MKPDFKSAWQQHDSLAASVPPRLRETLGGAFTPRALALRVAHETLGKFPRNDAPLVIDPACGLGSLMLAALEWACVNRPQWVQPWLGGRMQGWDISRELCDGTGRVLALAAKSLQLAARPKLVTRDALECDDREICDAVIACPPWKNLTGAAAQDMLPAARAAVARRFGSFTGTPALHTVFAELAGRLVKRQGGRVGMLLPMRVADSPDYASFRRAMAQLVAPEQIIPAGQDALPGVSDEAALFVLTAGRGDVSGEPWQARADANEQVYQSSLLRHIPLPPNAFADVGVNTGNAEQLLITTEPEAGAQPIRDASDVIPFAMRKPARYLRGKVPKQTGRYSKIAPPATFKLVKIVIKRDAQRPIAARHNPPAFFRDDLIGCFGTADLDDDYLLGVFNSEYFGRLYRDSFKQGRLRAEGVITIEQLRALPVPSKRAAGAAYKAIIEISQALQKGVGRDARLLAQLDTAVKKAYTGK